MTPPAGSPPRRATLFAGFGYILLQFAITPVRLRLMTDALEPAVYGFLGIVITTLTAGTVFCSLGMFEFLQRWLPGRAETDQRAIARLASRILTWVSAAVALLALAWMLRDPAWARLAGVESRLAAVAAAAGFFLNAQCMFRCYLLVARGEVVRLRLLQLAYADGWFLAICAAAVFTNPGPALAASLYAGWLLVAFLLLVRPLPKPEGTPAPDIRAGHLLGHSLPLVPLLLGEFFLRNGDRYIVLGGTDLAALAAYSICMNIALIPYLAGTNIIGLMIPALAHAMNQLGGEAFAGGRPHPRLRVVFSEILALTLLIGAASLGLFTGAAEAVMALLVAPAYRSAAAWLPCAAALSPAFLIYTLSSRVMIYLHRTREAGALTLGGAVLTLALAAFALPRWGEPGAALAVCGGLSLMAGVASVRIGLRHWIEPAAFPGLRLLAFALLSWPVWHGSVDLAARAGALLPARLGSLAPALGLALGAALHLALALALRLFSPRALAARMGGARG